MKLTPMKMVVNVDDETHMFLDRYYFSKRFYIFHKEDSVENNVEDTPLHSGDGMEARMIAKDALWKINNELVKRYGKGLNLKLRLIDQQNKRIPWHTQKRMRKIAEELGI